MKINAFIQARLSSTRFTNKVLLKLEGKTILQHIIERISQSKYIDNIVVATTTQPADDVLENYVEQKLSIPVVRGSVNNVLDRFHETLLRYPCDYIVRITADDPLKDSLLIDQLLTELLQSPVLDYCSNTIILTFPEGFDIECFKSSSLERAWKEAVKPSEKEHVTPFIWKHPELFHLKNYFFHEDLSRWRLTVDHEEDYWVMQQIFKHFKPVGNLFSYLDVINFLKERMDILEHNKMYIRNEGYIKSLKGEK